MMFGLIKKKEEKKERPKPGERMPRETEYGIGYRDGYKAAMENKISNTEALTEQESEALIKVLVHYGIEICYDDCICGLRLRKRDRIIEK